MESEGQDKFPWGRGYMHASSLDRLVTPGEEQPLSPSETDVRAQLKRIFSSADFDAPDRVRRFLTYVIEETIAGRAERLKAYSIAIEVFNRDASFDAQTDPVVRIEASRVRRTLEHYYLTGGAKDPLVITMPKGGYVPVFAWRDCKPDGPETGAAIAVPGPAARPPVPHWAWALAAGMLLLALGLIVGDRFLRHRETLTDAAAVAADTPRAVPDIPRLLVVPFRDLSGTQSSSIIARGLTDEVIAHIAKFKDITVLAGRSAELSAVDRRQARYILEGSLHTDADRIRLTVRLVNTADDAVVWANSYDARFSAHQLIEAERSVAREVATVVAQPYGIIFNADTVLVKDAPPDDWEAYTCTLAYYSYRSNLDPQRHASVRQCLERAVERFPKYATAWALLSLTYLDELRFQYRINPETPVSLDRALEAARRAVELDPENVRGLQAKMAALFFNEEVDAALKVGERAVAINPNDTELVGEYGIRLALSGEWQRGGDLIESVVGRNPGPLGYYETALALSYYIRRDYRSAAAWIRKPNVKNNPIYHMVAAAIFGQAGETAAAAAEREWLLKNAPQTVSDVKREMAIRNIRPDDQTHILEGLRKAGLPVTGP